MSRNSLTAVGYDISLCVVLRPMSKLWLILLPASNGSAGKVLSLDSSKASAMDGTLP